LNKWEIARIALFVILFVFDVVVLGRPHPGGP